MTVGVRQRKKTTEAQYLKMERAAEGRSEYFQGEVFAMAGAIELSSIGCRLALSEVYEQVILVVKEERPTWNPSPAQETS
jgi:hypothetical protein